MTFPAPHCQQFHTADTADSYGRHTKLPDDAPGTWVSVDTYLTRYPLPVPGEHWQSRNTVAQRMRTVLAFRRTDAITNPGMRQLDGYHTRNYLIAYEPVTVDDLLSRCVHPDATVPSCANGHARFIDCPEV